MLQGRCSATVLATAVLISGCSVRPATSQHKQVNHRAPSTVVTSQELAQAGGNANLLDVVRRLRPGWFESRNATPQVSVDGSPPSDILTLQALNIIEVHELRLERPTLSVGYSTVSSNGRSIRGDVIMVKTRVPGRRD